MKSHQILAAALVAIMAPCVFAQSAQASAYQDGLAHYKSWAEEQYAILAEQLSLGMTPILAEAHALQHNMPTRSVAGFGNDNSTFFGAHRNQIYDDFVARERSLRSSGCQQCVHRLSQAYWNAANAWDAIANAAENRKWIDRFPAKHEDGPER